MKKIDDSFNEWSNEELTTAHEQLSRIMTQRGLKEFEVINVTVTVKEEQNPLEAIGSIISGIAGSACFILSVVVWGVILTVLYAWLFT